MTTSEILNQITPVGQSSLPVAKEEIAEIENRFSKTLPDDYIYFITRFGKCVFEDDAKIDGCEVFIFFGSKANTMSVLEELRHYDQISNEGFLPFAIDSFGNLFLMDMGDYSIWFRDFSPKGITPRRRIANDFTDFLQKLELIPIPD